MVMLAAVIVFTILVWNNEIISIKTPATVEEGKHKESTGEWKESFVTTQVNMISSSKPEH